MTARTYNRFPLFELTLLVALALMGWVAFRLYDLEPQADLHRKPVIELRAEYFLISQYVESSINDLHMALTNFLQAKSSSVLQDFESRSSESQAWLDDQRQHWSVVAASGFEHEPVVSQTNQSALIQTQLLPLLSRISAAYKTYQSSAQYLIANSGQPGIKERIAQKQQNLQRARARLLALARESRMRGQIMDWFLTGPQHQYGKLEDRFQNMRFAVVLALVAVCSVLMLAIYRGQLWRTRRMLEQHKNQHLQQLAHLDKLANFGRLAQELAHEIKQPLTAINARAYTLQKSTPANTEAQKDAAVIRNETKRLDRILKDFLELAKPSEPKLEPMVAEAALQETCDLMGSQLAEEGIELKLEPNGEIQFLADAQQLKQVLLNLVKNAGESMDRGGTVTLRACKGQRELHGESTEAAILEVADTGQGIPAEIQKRIFDPFFSTKGEGGTGLGLAIAARIVDKHGGNLEFDSAPGKGTVFRIVLPACHDHHLHEQSTAH